MCPDEITISTPEIIQPQPQAQSLVDSAAEMAEESRVVRAAAEEVFQLVARRTWLEAHREKVEYFE